MSQQAIKEFKKNARKTMDIAGTEEDEWLIRPSNVLKNGLAQTIRHREQTGGGERHNPSGPKNGR